MDGTLKNLLKEPHSVTDCDDWGWLCASNNAALFICVNKE